MTDEMPYSGNWTFGNYRPGMLSIKARVLAICPRCGRQIAQWKALGTSPMPRCAGGYRAGCGALTDARNKAADAIKVREGKALKAAQGRARARAAAKRTKAENRAIHEARLAVLDAARRARLEQAEAERRLRCPRPDKEAWRFIHEIRPGDLIRL